MATLRLTCQNQLEVRLENAEISTVQFTTDNGSPVMEISFAYQKAEISHPSTGTKITLVTRGNVTVAIVPQVGRSPVIVALGQVVSYLRTRER